MKQYFVLLIIAAMFILTGPVHAGPIDLCPQTGIHCLTSGGSGPSDPLVIGVRMCNGYETLPLDVTLYVIMDVYGMFFFWPSWTTELDYIELTLDPCSCTDLTVMEITLPMGLNQEGIRFLSVMGVEGEYYFCEVEL